MGNDLFVALTFKLLPVAHQLGNLAPVNISGNFACWVGSFVVD